MYCYCKSCGRCFEEDDIVLEQDYLPHSDGSSPYNTSSRDSVSQHCPHCGSTDFTECFYEYVVVQQSGDELETYDELIDAERAAEGYAHEDGWEYRVFEKITDRYTGEVLYYEEF